jgi:putative oxidoreductase
MRKLFPPFIGGNAAGALLLMRVVVGCAFAMHGWHKIRSPGGMTRWMGDPQVPGYLQAAAACAEFGGGIAWMLGLLTPLACLLIIVTMVTALTTVHLPKGDPFVSASGPSYELPLTYLVIGLTLLLVGPGTFSLDAILFGRRPGGAEPPAPAD